MNNTYRFITDIEPTVKELDMLMIEVKKDVIRRAADANAKFKTIQNAYFLEMTKRQLEKKK